MYALLDKIRDPANKQDTGRILFLMAPQLTLFSFTPGNISDAVIAIMRVKKVAQTMCHVHKNIGKGNWNQSNTNLLKKIMTHDTEIQITMYTQEGAIVLY